MTTIDLTDELLDRWLERLQHPDTEQEFGRLRRRSTRAMCCLGHLCDLVDPDGWKDSSWTLDVFWGPGDHAGVSPPIYRNGVEVDRDMLAAINDNERRFPIEEIEALR